ncbi:MAG TPA: serine hydrolase [Nocardioidaceae bacterium]|nr:serine hydrolase [Nocardioidaceae bacterium]
MMSGFPPDEGDRWPLEHWQFGPENRWSFQHVREIVPTARVARSPWGPRALAPGEAIDLTVPVARVDGTTATAAQILDDTYTDGFLALADGRVVAEQYFNAMAADTPHLLMSVSKSIVSAVCAVLAGRGQVDVEAPLTAYIPEFAESGYAGATVRNLLDMRSGIAFSEDYLDTTAEVRQLEQVIGWAPRTMHDLPHSLYEWLATLTSKSSHGGPFEYRSCETDVLGWVCERASGVRMPDLLAEFVWGPLRTEYDMDAGVDPAGAVLHDGGLAGCLRDLGRFGQMIADDGVVPSDGVVDERQVIPAWWIRDTLQGDADSRDAFASSKDDTRMPGGMYRNQFWVPYPGDEVVMCLGIHGQMVYIDLPRRFVGVKFSSWPTPQNAAMFGDTLAMMRTLALSS